MDRVFRIMFVMVIIQSICVINVWSWSNLHWGSKDAGDIGVTTPHGRWYGGKICSKYEDDFYRYYATTVGERPLGGYYYYSTHDYILDLALYYLDLADDDVLNYSAVPCITNHGELDDTLFWTHVPDYVFGDFENHVELVHPGDYLSGDYRGYPDGTPFPACYGVNAIVERTGSFIQNIRLGRNAEARFDLGVLVHYVGDLYQSMHTDNLRVYNKNAVIPDAASPGGDKPYIGTAGVPLEWWKWAPAMTDPLYPKTIHSAYETATSFSIVMNAVESHALSALTPLQIGTPGSFNDYDYMTFLHGEISRINSYGYPPGITDYVTEVDIATDVYDGIVDGFETTADVGGRFAMLLSTYFRQLVPGDYVEGTDGNRAYGYTAVDDTDEVFEITVYNINRAGEQLTHYIYSALKETGAGTKIYNTVPQCAVESITVTPYSVWNTGEQLTFHAAVSDYEDGILSGQSLIWVDSAQGTVGTDTDIDLRNFGPGSHNLVIKAYDSNGACGKWNIPFEVVDRGIQISEMCPDPAGADRAAAPDGEYIVLYNNSTDIVDVGTGTWGFTDKNGAELTINESGSYGEGSTNGVSTNIPPGGNLTVYRNGHASFSLNNDGDMITLYSDLDRKIRADREIYGTVDVDEIVSFPTLSGPANSTPTVLITSPPDEYETLTGMPVELMAAANDAEDGPLDPAIQWVSDNTGYLGTGNHVIVPELPPGIHTITALVEDSGHHVGNQHITVFVQPRTELIVPWGSGGILTIIFLAYAAGKSILNNKRFSNFIIPGRSSRSKVSN